jgi:thiamine biosynthesis lipoprotein
MAPATTATRSRTVHVEHCMGTPFSIDIRDPGTRESAISQAVAFLHRADAAFSTYRPGRELMRLRRGVLALEEADPSLTEVLGLCGQMETETGGYFTAAWNGNLDPTGLVKGWAVEHASRLLLARGSRNHVINGGGDI